MATANLYFDIRNKKAEKFPLTIQVSHRSRQKYIATGYKLTLADWDEGNKKVKKSFPNSTRANTRIRTKLTIAEQVIERYKLHLKEMTVYQLAEVIIEEMANNDKKEISPEKTRKGTTLIDYGQKVIKMYEEANQTSMADGFHTAINSLIKFHGKEDLLITDIDEMFLLTYEKYFRKQTDKINGYGAYLRYIRRIYNLAIKDKNTEVNRSHYPFGKEGYSIKKGKSKKKAIDISFIQVIRELDYKEGSAAWHHRNYLLFMFNCRGMNFIDLAYLKKSNISEGRLRYRRRKTKRGENVKEFNIKITEEAQGILEHYWEEGRAGDLVFPILEDVIENPDENHVYNRYRERRSTHNDWLEKIGKDAGIPGKLTTYVIRHTFATALKYKGVSKAKIGDMLGHTNYYTTEEYFEDFEQEALDEAAEVILK